MLRDISFVNNLKLNKINENIQIERLLIKDIDNDNKEELLLFNKHGDLLLLKNNQTYFSSDLHSLLPLNSINIFLFASKIKTPSIILLSVDGLITISECLSLKSDSTIEFLPIFNQNIQLWNCLHCEPFIQNGKNYLAITNETIIHIYKYNIGLELTLEAKIHLSCPIYSLSILSGSFLIAGLDLGLVEVVSLWNEPNNEKCIPSQIKVKEGYEPPLPSFDSTSNSLVGSPIIIQDLHIYDCRDKLKKFFAVAWNDGRVCICNITKLTSNVEQYEWSVIQSFHTKYSFFQLNLLRFKNLNPIIENSNRETETSLNNIESNDNLEAYWQSVHGDNEDDPLSNESGCLNSISDLFLVLSSHTGHTLFISLIPTDFGEDLQTSSTIYERKIYSYDSRHSLHSQVVKLTSIGRINHITNSTSPLNDMNINDTNINVENTDDSIDDSIDSSSPYCLVYITTNGDCWIVTDIEKELSQYGPPVLPQLQFETSDIEKANRIVRMWNIISSIPRNKGNVNSYESDHDHHQFHSNEQSNEGIALIQRLLSTSIEDLQKMVEFTSLNAWKELLEES